MFVMIFGRWTLHTSGPMRVLDVSASWSRVVGSASWENDGMKVPRISSC